MSAEDRADYSLISDVISQQLLELDEIQNWRHNPTVYVEMVGNGLFYPWSLEYAPKPERYRHIIARLAKMPAVVEQAKKNLASAPEIWITVAMEENDGNIGLIDKTLRAGAPEELKADYGKAAGAALDALRAFNEYLKTDLATRPGEWRLGKEKYAKKFGYVLETDQTPEQVLAAAEEALKEVRKEMFKLSVPLHAKMYPTHRDRAGSEPDRRGDAGQDRRSNTPRPTRTSPTPGAICERLGSLCEARTCCRCLRATTCK